MVDTARIGAGRAGSDTDPTPCCGICDGCGRPSSGPRHRSCWHITTRPPVARRRDQIRIRHLRCGICGGCSLDRGDLFLPSILDANGRVAAIYIEKGPCHAIRRSAPVSYHALPNAAPWLPGLESSDHLHADGHRRRHGRGFELGCPNDRADEHGHHVQRRRQFFRADEH